MQQHGGTWTEHDIPVAQLDHWLHVDTGTKLQGSGVLWSPAPALLPDSTCANWFTPMRSASNVWRGTGLRRPCRLGTAAAGGSEKADSQGRANQQGGAPAW